MGVVTAGILLIGRICVIIHRKKIPATLSIQSERYDLQMRSAVLKNGRFQLVLRDSLRFFCSRADWAKTRPGARNRPIRYIYRNPQSRCPEPCEGPFGGGRSRGVRAVREKEASLRFAHAFCQPSSSTERMRCDSPCCFEQQFGIWRHGGLAPCTFLESGPQKGRPMAAAESGRFSPCLAVVCFGESGLIGESRTAARPAIGGTNRQAKAPPGGSPQSAAGPDDDSHRAKLMCAAWRGIAVRGRDSFRAPVGCKAARLSRPGR
jgi:hypothetical protein